MTELQPQKPLDPKLFGPNPARDERFDSKDRWHELPNVPHDHPDSSLEFLTRQMNEEINATEMAACNLVDFPDAEAAFDAVRHLRRANPSAVYEVRPIRLFIPGIAFPETAAEN
jgi:hypothetical protein